MSEHCACGQYRDLHDSDIHSARMDGLIAEDDERREADARAIAEMIDDDYEAIATLSFASLQAQYREFGYIENGERVYPPAAPATR